MKKLLFTLLLSSVLSSVTAFASSDVRIEKSYVPELFQTIGVELYASDEASVTRKEFTNTLMQLLFGGKQLEGLNSAHPFRDIDDTMKEAGAIYAAEDMGIVSASSLFRPNDSILLDEALKMSVTAAGYFAEAEANNGYPTGYRIIAKKIGLTDNIDMTQETISYDAYLQLLTNLINTEIRVIVYDGNGYYHKNSNGRTILTEYFNLIPVNGVMTANHITSIYDPDEIPGKYIQIENRQYLADGYDAYLGMRVTGYAKEINEEPTIIFLSPNYEKELFVNYDQLSDFNGASLQYYAEDKLRNIALDDAVLFVYNKKALPKPQADDFILDYGNLHLIDNDGNGSYDVVFINRAQSILIKNVDNKNMRIYDSNSKFFVDGAKYDATMEVTLNGVPCELSSLKPQMVANCYISKDNKHITIHAANTTVSGEISSYSDAKRTVVINDTKYTVSPYFKKYYSYDPGTSKTFTLDSFGNIISAAIDSDTMQYGYIIGAAETKGIDTDYRVKLFNQEGNYIIADLNEKVTVDDTTMNAEYVYKNYLAPGGSVKEQLVRYKLNPDKKLRYLDTIYSQSDTSTEATGFLPKQPNINDRLRRYQLPVSGTLTGNSYMGLISNYVHLSASTPIFLIRMESNVPDEDKCVLSSLGSASHTTYDTSRLQIYDVNTGGTAGAVVYLSDKSSASTPGEEASKGIVCSVENSINQDGAPTINIEVYNANGSFETLCVEDLSLLNSQYTDEDKATELSISPGDYIRYAFKSNNVLSGIIKDYDASSEKVLCTRNNENDRLRYFYGYAYDTDDGYQLLAKTTDLNSVESQETTFHCLKQVGSIAIYNSKTETVSPASASEIIQYMQNSSEADKILMTTRYIETKAIVIYR